MEQKHDSELRAIPGWSGYEITRDGRIYSTRRAKLKEMSQYIQLGYRCVKANGKHLRVNIALLLAFGGPKPSDQHMAIFLDGDPSNLSLSNLQWANRNELLAKMVDRGTHHKTEPGTPSINRRFDNQTLSQIKSRLASGDTAYRIAKDLNINSHAIYAIKEGRTYQRMMEAA